MLESLAEAVLTSTHNLCFGSKLTKKGYEGVYISRKCLLDENLTKLSLKVRSLLIDSASYLVTHTHAYWSTSTRAT